MLKNVGSLGSFGDPFGVLWESLGILLGPLGILGDLLGVPWASFGSLDRFGLILGSFWEAFWGPKSMFLVSFFENFLEHHFFEILHGVQARRSFWRVKGPKLGPKRRRKGEKNQGQQQEGFGGDFGGPDGVIS